MTTATPRVEEATPKSTVDELTELKLALGDRHVTESSRIVDEQDDGSMTTQRGGVNVIHTRMRKVRLYKPTGGFREVPANNLERLVDKYDGGWLLHCPICGEDCMAKGVVPWGCANVPEPKFFECPVPGCCEAPLGSGNPKRFYFRPQPASAQQVNPNRVEDNETKIDTAQEMARAEYYTHMRTRHLNFAVAADIPGAREAL